MLFQGSYIPGKILEYSWNLDPRDIFLEFYNGPGILYDPIV